MMGTFTDGWRFPSITLIEQKKRITMTRAFLLMVYSMDGDSPRTCYGATIFG
jgi:hypothetical protein